MADPKGPPQGRFARFRKLASLSAQLGSGVLSRGVKRLAGADPSMLNKGAAEKIVATLGDLKGAAMKLGQAVSMDPELLTPEVRAILAKLQNQAPSMPYEQVRRMVEEDLGAPPERLFRDFEPEPLAAASLGQVHKAHLHGGREVAVKVQYPGIAAALTSDLDNLGFLVKALSRTSRALDGRAYFQELRDEMALEVDYRREAALARAFALAASALPDLKVPEVFEERTGERVLTLEYLPGKTLRDFVAAEPSAPERFRISRLLIRATYGPFLLTGEMHADPHPGNFVVMPDGRLGVLDFGSVKRFSPTFAAAHRRMFLKALRQQPIDVLAVCREVGFSIELPDEEAAPLIREVLQIAGRPMRSGEYDYASCQISRDTKQLFRQNAASFLKLRPPAEAVMFFRSTGGLSQNLKTLAAKGDFRAIYRELGPLAESSS
ncbi:MAG: AarF/ABC1/UbiB kinase family protein [Myxococcales bacterium]|nr:AarF/ABC1/UbiB kinase family protein [Myxococcales bacterium]